MDFFNFLLYIFLNSTISLCSTFYLLQPFFFYLNFHINFLLLPFHLSPIPSKLSMTKKIILSLSLWFCFSFGGFFVVTTTFFLLLMVLFVIVDLTDTSHFFLFLENLYWLLCIFICSSIPIRSYTFFSLSHWFYFIWVNNYLFCKLYLIFLGFCLDVNLRDFTLFCLFFNHFVEKFCFRKESTLSNWFRSTLQCHLLRQKQRLVKGK